MWKSYEMVQTWAGAVLPPQSQSWPNFHLVILHVSSNLYSPMRVSSATGNSVPPEIHGWDVHRQVPSKSNHVCIAWHSIIPSIWAHILMPTLPGLNPIFPNCTYTSTKKEGFLLLKTMNSNRRLLCTSTSLNWVVAPALCQILSKVLKRWLLSRPSNFLNSPA